MSVSKRVREYFSTYACVCMYAYVCVCVHACTYVKVHVRTCMCI
jgi:hypothetical protein